VEIYFSSNNIAKICNNHKEGIKVLGQICAAKLRQRLFELRAAANLAQISHLPPPRCHMLTGDRKNQFAVILHGGFRLVFQPLEDPLPYNEDGGIDRSKVTQILINEVGDYHD